MNDSGRQAGTCKHGAASSWDCVRCLRGQVERLRESAANALFALGEPDSLEPVVTLAALAVGYQAEIERLKRGD